jgi:hypothetical protein
VADYKRMHFVDASKFVDAITPTAPHFSENGEWIFRGQPKDLDLLPSAFRVEKMAHLKKRAWHEWTNADQARAELDIITRFYETADRAGLSIPEDSYQLRQALAAMTRSRRTLVKVWPPGELWPLIALAQHHRVPTRFLDWTYSPFVAAYFAAEEIARDASRVADDWLVVVWAFDVSLVGIGTPVADDGEVLRHDNRGGGIEVVTAPYGNNRNMAAQRGVHLMYRPLKVLKSSSPVLREPFDQALQHIHKLVRDYHKALFKLTLPASQAGPLLRLLSKYGVSGATLFPGFDGVARAIAEEDQWYT